MGGDWWHVQGKVNGGMVNTGGGWVAAAAGAAAAAEAAASTQAAASATAGKVGESGRGTGSKVRPR